MPPVHKEMPADTARRIQWYLHQVHDGLSKEHLKKLLPRNTERQIHSGLSWLKAADEVCLSGNGWWYSLVDPQLLAPDPTIQSTTEPLPMSSLSRAVPVSVADRLYQWLIQRPLDAEPIQLVDLAEQLASNANTLSKSLKRLTEQLIAQEKPELAQQLQSAVLRKPSTVSAKKPDPVVAPEPADDWVVELKQQLMTPCLTDHRRVQWKETLWQLDSVLKELGVADDQRSRVHLREIHDWLNF